MVQTDISQLSGECNTWREQLRNYREEFTQDESRIRQVANQALTKQQLLEIEHLHNQFHIQLINIHDLKQSIKSHDRLLAADLSKGDTPLNSEILQQHETLGAEYHQLSNTLHNLRTEFNDFLSRTQ